MRNLEERLELERIDSIEPIRVPVWAWLAVAVLVFAVWAITMENGQLLAGPAERLHEFFHDARHFVAVPCH